MFVSQIRRRFFGPKYYSVFRALPYLNNQHIMPLPASTKPARSLTTGYEPLFHFLDAFNSWDKGLSPNAWPVQPVFDIKEVDDAYELYGELPGITKENVSVEVVGPRTLLISGRFERTYETGKPPSEILRDSRLVNEPHKEDGAASTDKTIASSEKKDDTDTSRYWIAERKIGQFSRSFNFNQDIREEGSSATLKDGILNLRVLKAGNMKKARIQICA